MCTAYVADPHWVSASACLQDLCSFPGVLVFPVVSLTSCGKATTPRPGRSVGFVHCLPFRFELGCEPYQWRVVLHAGQSPADQSYAAYSPTDVLSALSGSWLCSNKAACSRCPGCKASPRSWQPPPFSPRSKPNPTYVGLHHQEGSVSGTFCSVQFYQHLQSFR